MTREQFVRIKWKAYQIVEYTNNRAKNIDGGVGVTLECFVCAIDFDDGVLLLQNLSTEYDMKDKWVSHENCELPKPKMKKA